MPLRSDGEMGDFNRTEIDMTESKTADVASEQQTPKVAHVLVAIQQVKRALAEQGIGKSRQNQEQQFKFRGIDDILNALAAPLVNANLIVFPHVEERKEVVHEQQDGNRIKRFTRVALNIRFQFISSVDGSAIDARIQSEASDHSDKATNKAISFAMKYAYIAVFNIPVVGAEDGDFESPGNETQRAPSGNGSAGGTGPAQTQTASSATTPTGGGGAAGAPEPAAKKTRATRAKAPEQKDEALIQFLSTLPAAVADRLAPVMQRAYGVKTVADIPAAKVPEALERAKGWLEKQASTTAKAAEPAASSDIPE